MKNKFCTLLSIFLIFGFRLSAQTTQGGGVYIYDAKIFNTVIAGNVATDEGTGIYAAGASELFNNTIADNRQVKLFSSKVGDVYEDGVVFYIDYVSRTALLVSFTELPVSAFYKLRTYGEAGQNISGAIDLNNGKSNTEAIIAAQTIIPDIDADRDNQLAVNANHSSHFKLPADTIRRAAHWCVELTDGGHTDWFLPSREQLKKLFVAKDDVNNTLQLINAVNVPLNDACYLSSTQGNAYEAWYVFFDNGETNLSAKSNVANVRAIREVKF
jgi:hypothetical protein